MSHGVACCLQAVRHPPIPSFTERGRAELTDEYWCEFKIHFGGIYLAIFLVVSLQVFSNLLLAETMP